MTDLILQALYSGLLQGGSYALIALGLALVFGAMKVINLAHGELVLLSAYIAYSVEAGLGWNPVFAIPIALVVVCLASAPSLSVGKVVFAAVKGEIPSPLHPPSGCHFHPRCPHAMPRCSSEKPLLRQIGPDRFSACHLNDEAVR